MKKFSFFFFGKSVQSFEILTQIYPFFENLLTSRGSQNFLKVPQRHSFLAHQFSWPCSTANRSIFFIYSIFVFRKGKVVSYTFLNLNFLSCCFQSLLRQLKLEQKTHNVENQTLIIWCALTNQF